MNRNLGRALLVFSCMALASCAQLYPFHYTDLVSAPLEIGPEWSEIHCPLAVDSSLPLKMLYLRLTKGDKVPDFHDKAIVRRDGERVTLQAEVVTADGRTFALTEWQQLGIITERGGSYVRVTGPGLPRTMKVTTFRLRSSAPVTFQEVLWTDARIPGDPVARY